MNPMAYLRELNAHLSYLYAFARQINELDFAGSLGGEFRGAQDAGWATTITAQEVFQELTGSFGKSPQTKADLRVMLMLYCQLAEAGGFYESLKNVMGVVALKPYVLWPFRDLVKVKDVPRRIIGPNANATFRDLATMAKRIGLATLSSLLEDAFRDDIRNGVSHADYVIWTDGLRLRKRNGGYAERVPFEEISETLTRGAGFYQMLQEHNEAAVWSFHPPREIVGRFSANPPMPWTVAFDPESGAFSLSGSSPGSVTTPAFVRQTEINNRLGGKVMSVFGGESDSLRQLETHVLGAGFDPNYVEMTRVLLSDLASEVEALGLWDERQSASGGGDVLLASPWGFRWIHSPADFDAVLPEPNIDFDWGDWGAAGS